MELSVFKLLVLGLLAYPLAAVAGNSEFNHRVDTQAGHQAHTTPIRVQAAANWVKKVRMKTIKAVFAGCSHAVQPEGWASREEAAIAFYQAHDDAYLATDENEELAGLILESDTGRYFFTDAIDAPTLFTLQATVQLPGGWRVAGYLHTHPNDGWNQERFSKADFLGMLASSRAYFLRTPRGDLRYMDPKVGRRTRRTGGGAKGISVCPGEQPCLTPHDKNGSRFR